MERKTLIALNASIKHHKENLAMLEEGFKNKERFSAGLHSFFLGEKEVSFGGWKCALCALFGKGECECHGCPLYEADDCCNWEDSTWRKLSYSLTIEGAIKAEKAMIAKLTSLKPKRRKV